MSFLSKFISELFGSSELKNSTISQTVQKPKIDESVSNSISELENSFSETLKNHKVKKSKTTKYGQVKLHLYAKGSITSWEAIQLYGATRLSAIIFKLRNSGYVIESISHTELDRNKNTTNFVTYKLHI
jgi:hypothetical protein